MKQVRKKSFDRATENAVAQASRAGIPLVFDRYEEMVPACGFGRMGLDCKACTQGPCRINPFDASNGTVCGRDREATVAASFLRLISDGAIASAAYAGAQSRVAATLFGGITLANEGTAPPARLLHKAIDVATAAFQTLPSSQRNGSAPRTVQVGLGALKPDRINILLLGSIQPARAGEIAAELAASDGVNVVGAVGGEIGGVAVAGNYNSQEALLVTTCVDGVVIGSMCVAPGFLALAARQGVPVVDADRFEASALLDGADAHFRMNQGRNMAARLPAAAAFLGFGPAAFDSLTAPHWESLATVGVRGVALIGGCNNAATTQDGPIVRQATEFLKNEMVVVTSGCAAVALARAGFMDPSGLPAIAGKKVGSFLSALSEAAGVQVPAVLEAGTCWELPAALELAALFQRRLAVPLMASMPEVSRPAAWSSALAVAASGLPTYVGPILPLDGGLQTVDTLNSLLGAGGGRLVGPGQVGDPEAVVSQMLGG